MRETSYIKIKVGKYILDLKIIKHAKFMDIELDLLNTILEFNTYDSVFHDLLNNIFTEYAEAGLSANYSKKLIIVHGIPLSRSDDAIDDFVTFFSCLEIYGVKILAIDNENTFQDYYTKFAELKFPGE